MIGFYYDCLVKCTLLPTIQDHWRFRARGLLKDFATDQLGRGRTRLDSHHAIEPILADDDVAAYEYLRSTLFFNRHCLLPYISVLAVRNMAIKVFSTLILCLQ